MIEIYYGYSWQLDISAKCGVSLECGPKALAPVETVSPPWSDSLPALLTRPQGRTQMLSTPASQLEDVPTNLN